MRKVRFAVALAAALLVAGLASWKAEATTAAGTGLPDAVAKYSLIEKAACATYGKHCPPGYTWVCKPNNPNKCWCARC